MIRVLRGQGDQWDSRARARGVTASFSLNGIGLVPEETTDLYQENEELKVYIIIQFSLYNSVSLYLLYKRIGAIFRLILNSTLRRRSRNWPRESNS